MVKSTQGFVESQNNLVMSILCEEFGCHIVSKSIEYKQSYKNLVRYKPSLVSEVFTPFPV